MINYAILGYGFMGKKHHEVILSNPNATVTAIIDKNEINSPDIEYFQCLDFFLEKPRNVDVVIISTPNSDHFHSAKKLLENGYTIFLEKPYCFTKKQTEELQKISYENKKQIFFSNQNRKSPIATFLKDIIDKNILGEIYFIQSNLFWSRNENYYQKDSWKGTKDKDGGTLYTQFFHFVDLIMWAFGDIEIRNVVAKTLKHKSLIEIEDTGTVTFELKNKETIGVLNFSTAVYDRNFESSLTIIAENGTLKISGQYFDEVEYCNIKNFDINDYLIGKTDNLSNLRDNLNYVNENCKNYSLNGISESMNIVSKIEQIYNSL